MVFLKELIKFLPANLRAFLFFTMDSRVLVNSANYGRYEERRSSQIAGFSVLCIFLSIAIFSFINIPLMPTLNIPKGGLPSVVQLEFVQIKKVLAQEDTNLRKLLSKNSEITVPFKEQEEIILDEIEQIEQEQKPEVEQNIKEIISEKAVESTIKAPETEKMETVGHLAGRKMDADRMQKALAVLMQAIEEYKDYPKQARRLGAEGINFLLVTIDANGKVIAAELEKESGSWILDKTTIKLGSELVNLQLLDKSTEESFQVSVPVEYSLDNL